VHCCHSRASAGLSGELLFRSVKQHLRIRSFRGRSETASRIQILMAMIAFLLLRISARQSRSKLTDIRFAGLVRRCLLQPASNRTRSSCTRILESINFSAFNRCRLNAG